MCRKRRDFDCNNNSGFCGGISPCCVLIAAAIFFRGRRRECDRDCCQKRC